MLFFPVKGIPNEPTNIMPRVRVPKTERIRRPQQCKSIKGFYCQLEPGLLSHSAQWSLDESPKPRFTAVFISLEQRQGVGQGWLAAGVSWYLLIGQSSSLWLARVIIILIGQSYHLSDWPELPSLEALKAWLRDYFWPSAPLWACHGSGEVVTFPPVFRSYRGIFLFVLGYSLILLSKHK